MNAFLPASAASIPALISIVALSSCRGAVTHPSRDEGAPEEAAGGSESGERESATLARAIDSIAESALAEGPIAGLSLAVVRGDKTIVAKGYGYADLERRVPATADTSYHVCSITKNLTAAAILDLADQERVGLDEEITVYLPDLPVQGRRIELRHLLSHTSGLKSYTDADVDPDGSIARTDLPHDEILDLFSHEPFEFEPGAGWRYCNSGYYLLGLVVEHVTGSSYSAWMRDHLFAPLGMSGTTATDDPPAPDRRTRSYESRDGRLLEAGPISWNNAFSGGQIQSTVRDLLRWEAALDGGRVIDSDSLARMRTPTLLADGTRIDYGLGVRLGALDGHPVFGHTGGGGGYSTVLERIPDADVTIVVLMNTACRVSARTIACRIARRVLGLPARPVSEVPLSPSEIERFTGTWTSDDGRLITSECAGRLCAAPEGRPSDAAPAAYVGRGTFAIDEDARATFVPESGPAEWIIESYGGLFDGAWMRAKP